MAALLEAGGSQPVLHTGTKRLERSGDAGKMLLTLAVAAELLFLSGERLGALFEVAAGMGALRGLVNNAGVLGPQSRVEALTAPRIRRTLEVNVVGTLLCCREAVARQRDLLNPGGP